MGQPGRTSEYVSVGEKGDTCTVGEGHPVEYFDQ